MRLICLSILSFLLLICISGELGEDETAPLGPNAAHVVFSSRASAFGRQATGVRTPTNEPGQPGTWAQLATKKKTVDVTELKTQAGELITMSQALPGQMEQIGNGKYPKELIDNLKKIEKLSKHIRGEIE
jgi:hypothetical protein